MQLVKMYLGDLHTDMQDVRGKTGNLIDLLLRVIPFFFNTVETPISSLGNTIKELMKKSNCV